MQKLSALAISGMLILGTNAYAADQTLVSSKAKTPIVLDGMADKAWDAAAELQ